MFNYSSHLLSNFDTISIYDKFDYSKFINLSSNELNHEFLQDFYEKFISHFDYRLIAKYPFIEPYRDFFAEVSNTKTNQIAFSAGSDIAIHLLIRIFAKSNRAILQYPNYRAYEDAIKINNIITLKEDFFSANFINSLKTKIISSEPSIVIITTPDSFIGKVLTCNELIPICELGISKDHMIIIDETYAPYCSENYGYLLKFPNVILVKTLSKFPGMAGLRFCLIKGSEEAIEYIRKSSVESTVSNFSLEYAKYCYLHPDKINRVLLEIKQRRQMMQAHISDSLGWISLDSQGNFCAIKANSKNDIQNFKLFLLENGIKIKTFEAYANLSNIARITVPDKPSLEHLLIKITEYATN